MTEEWLKGLPENLSAAEVYLLLGTGKEGLRVLRAEHPEIVARRSGRDGKGKCKYSRSEVFKLGKIKA